MYFLCKLRVNFLTACFECCLGVNYTYQQGQVLSVVSTTSSSLGALILYSITFLAGSFVGPSASGRGSPEAYHIRPKVTGIDVNHY